jgi:tetratricopeptide (TPR) repeat protein
VDCQGDVYAVAFSPDSKTIFTYGLNETSRLWDAPEPLPDEWPRLAAWVETLTGLELDDGGGVRPLDNAAWRGRRERLAQLGGPPSPDPPPRLDPILFGPEPTARGAALAERGLFQQAEAAYAEATRARPFSSFVWGTRGRFYITSGRPERAAAVIAEAIRLLPDTVWLRRWHCLSLLAAGDRIGWERAIADLRDSSQGLLTAYPSSVAWLHVLAPSTVADLGVSVRLAEDAVQGASSENKTSKSDALTTLGAVLYRAGRYDEAIRRLEEGIGPDGERSPPREWAFLAMAHHRLGHQAESRRWLDRLRSHQPSADPTRFWDELEIRLLRSEAEAIILYDPAFPGDPLAR